MADVDQDVPELLEVLEGGGGRGVVGPAVGVGHHRSGGPAHQLGVDAGVAVAELPGGIRLSGVPGWLAWLFLHLVMLVGFRNRANVLVNWAWNYVTYDRASRLILDPPTSVGHHAEGIRGAHGEPGRSRRS